MSGISVVIPTLPGREAFLSEAIASVARQTLQPECVIVVHDLRADGAAMTRSRGLSLVKTEWTAFLDDDDILGPLHLEHLLARATETEADLVFPWFDVVGGKDPFPANEKREWTLAEPHHTTVTFLVRTKPALAVGAFLDGLPQELWPGAPGQKQGEEFRFVLRLAEAGYKVEKLYERTWVWRHHKGNTSGQAPEPRKSSVPERRPPRVVGWAQ